MTHHYQDKVVAPSEAIHAIKDGDLVVLGHAAGVPQLSVQALAKDYKDFHNVRIFHLVTLGEAPYAQPEMEGHFRMVTSFVGGNVRDALNSKRGDFIPNFFYRIPRHMREGVLPVDVAIIQVSLPDEEGYCSYGISCDYTKPAAEVARVVIAEVNKQMPYVYGNNKIHLSDIDYIIEADYPLYELPLPRITEVEEAIGQHVASLVEDGDTLQLGIGSIPDATLHFLKDKKDLGIHTEMFSDGVLELVKQGVVTGKCKEREPEKLTATFLMGTRALYDFVHKNPSVWMDTVDIINDPCTIMQLEHMVSINGCIEVDLMGQVVSETIGEKQFSGTGGQVDYVRGASMSRYGRSIMAMPSTAAKGKVSRIVPQLTPGGAVTTSRNDVDYIVTEYGIAHLQGKSLRERAEALTKIAHPDFRPELEAELRRRWK